MTLEQLRIFVTVANHLNMTRAAQGLNLTQSAVSAAVAALEERHGIRLFDRIGRGIRLSAEGQWFLDEAKGVLARAAAAERALADLSGLRQGSLRLWASQTIAAYWLPGFLHLFRRRYPGLRLDLHHGNSADVERAVLSHDADLGLVEGPVTASGVDMRVVGADEMMLVVGRGHPWHGRLSVSDAELGDSDWVLREEGSGTRQVMEELLTGRGVRPAVLSRGFCLPSNEAVCTAVAAGAGASILSKLVVSARLAMGDLVCIGPALAQRKFSAICNNERSWGRAAQALLTVIDENGQDSSDLF